MLTRRTSDAGELVDPGARLDAEPTAATLRRVHIHYIAGRYEQAIAAGESALRHSGSARQLGRIRYYTAMAYLQLGRPEQGAALLVEARKYAAAAGAPRMLVECMAADAALALLRQDRNAVVLAHQALAACRKLTPIHKPLEARTLMMLASCYLVEGEWALALDAGTQALERLAGSFDISRRAKVFDCMAFAYVELGRPDLAIDYGRRAIELHAVARDTLSLARSENTLGFALTRRGDLAEARAHLQRSAQLYELAGAVNGHSQMLLSLGELSLAEGAPERARELAARGLELAERLHEEGNVAEAHLVLAQAAEALSEPGVADAELLTALEGCARRGSRGLIARCHRMYAEVLERRGQRRLARRHLLTALKYQTDPPPLSA